MKTRIKNRHSIITMCAVTVMIFISQMTYAQFPGGGMGGGQGMRGQGMHGGGMRGERPNMQMKEINFEESAGIIHYNVAEAIKSSKIKDNKSKALIEAAFQCYEDSLQRISLTNFDELETLKKATAELKKKKSNQDMSKMRETMKITQESMRKLRPICMKYDKMLLDSLENGLSEKEWNNISKYLEKIKKEKQPAMPQSPKMRQQEE